ncbi:MAG: glycosyltransferase family 2 protein [Candidatus Pelagibacter sp.]
MKKVFILIPIYNDWESLIKLLNEINKSVLSLNDYEFKCIVINDASTVLQPKILKPTKFQSLKIINMKENRGHARCNAFGLKYINSKEVFDYVILMDGDGEDRPEEIKNLLKKVENNPEISVVAKRAKRSEGPLFRSLYKIHKIITFIFTGKKINFGYFSCLIKNDINILLNQASLWNNYSGSVKKHIHKYNEIDSVRGFRYFGPSQMSLFNLVIHSFSIISVFKYSVFLRSSFMIIIFSFLTTYIGMYSIIFQILLVIFNLLIFIISLRENKKSFLNSDKNVKDELNIIH